MARAGFGNGGARASGDRSLGDLVGEATGEVSLLFRKELELAKLEVKDELRVATDAGKFFGVAGLTAFLAVFLLSFAAAWGLAEVMPAGVAFLIIGVLYALVAGIAFVLARQRVEHFHPVPEETVETLKEDVQWLKERKSSN